MSNDSFVVQHFADKVRDYYLSLYVMLNVKMVHKELNLFSLGGIPV